MVHPDHAAVPAVYRVRIPLRGDAAHAAALALRVRLLPWSRRSAAGTLDAVARSVGLSPFLLLGIRHFARSDRVRSTVHGPRRGLSSATRLGGACAVASER